MTQVIRQVHKGSKVSKEIKEIKEQVVADLWEKTVAQSEILVCRDVSEKDPSPHSVEF